MTLPAFDYPVLGFGPVIIAYKRVEGEDLAGFRDESDLMKLPPSVLDGTMEGMLLVDSSGRTWEIRAVRDLGVSGSFWKRLFHGYHDVEYDMVEGPSLSLDAVKTRICALIEADPYSWLDPEVMAGEDGAPREEADMLEEIKRDVWKASNLKDIYAYFRGDGIWF